MSGHVVGRSYDGGMTILLKSCRKPRRGAVRPNAHNKMAAPEVGGRHSLAQEEVGANWDLQAVGAAGKSALRSDDYSPSVPIA